jgi:hypothetical protein
LACTANDDRRLTKETPVKDFDEIIATLKRERDELRVQMKLGSMELRDEVNEEWQEFQAKLDQFSLKAEVKEAREEIAEELDELAEDIREGFEKLRNKLKD